MAIQNMRIAIVISSWCLKYGPRRRIHKETLSTILSVVHGKEGIEIEISLARAKVDSVVYHINNYIIVYKITSQQVYLIFSNVLSVKCIFLYSFLHSVPPHLTLPHSLFPCAFFASSFCLCFLEITTPWLISDYLTSLGISHPTHFSEDSKITSTNKRKCVCGFCLSLLKCLFPTIVIWLLI